MDFGIKGKKALVLAASRGLGLGIAEALAAEGVDLLLVGRTAERLEKNAAAINARGAGKAAILAIDLGAPGAVDAIHAEAMKVLGQVDILINNSGGPPAKTALQVVPEEIPVHLAQMVLPQIGLANKVLPGMRERKWGRIVNVASSGLIQPIANLALSNAIRPMLLGWAKTLAEEVAADGVTVNMILPGRIATDRIAELDAANAARVGKSVDEVSAASKATIPAKRLGTAEEFGATAAFLCSQQAAYITGSQIRVDGGALRNV